MSRVVQETHIIMEFCDRGSVQDAMEQNVFALDDGGRAGGLDMDLVVMTLAEVATAMGFLHQHRITHRDLKPKNILLKSSTKDRRGFCAKARLGFARSF
jgi:serine/threonine protein kinase